MSNVTTLPKRPARGRSAVTNGVRLLVEGDNGSKWARRLRDLFNGYLDHLGGRDAAGVARIAIVRRIATIELSLEAMEATASTTPDKLDLDQYQRAANTHRRLVESLGLDPRFKTVEASAIEQHFSRPPERSA